MVVVEAIAMMIGPLDLLLEGQVVAAAAAAVEVDAVEVQMTGRYAISPFSSILNWGVTWVLFKALRMLIL